MVRLILCLSDSNRNFARGFVRLSRNWLIGTHLPNLSSADRSVSSFSRLYHNLKEQILDLIYLAYFILFIILLVCFVLFF